MHSHDGLASGRVPDFVNNRPPRRIQKLRYAPRTNGERGPAGSYDRKEIRMKKVVPLLFSSLLFAASAAHGQSPTTNVCGTTIATPGGTFTWTSTYSVPIRVQPVTGESWFLGQSYVVIPANGSVTIDVPQNLAPGTNIDLQVNFDTRAGGNPCGNTPGPPRIQNPT